tara:strand:- start:702 stop:1127 length:426 start_codon:yes stop_codon:yes gene_type:complete
MQLIMTLLGGSILGFVTTLIGQVMKAKAEQHRMMIAAMAQQQKAVAAAREHGLKDKQFAFTRRIIAFICVGCIVVIPFIAPFFDIPVVVSVTEKGEWYIPFIWEQADKVIWKSIEGIALAPAYIHTLAAIVSFYFGSSAAR